MSLTFATYSDLDRASARQLIALFYATHRASGKQGFDPGRDPQGRTTELGGDKPRFAIDKCREYLRVMFTEAELAAGWCEFTARTASGSAAHVEPIDLPDDPTPAAASSASLATNGSGVTAAAAQLAAALAALQPKAAIDTAAVAALIEAARPGIIAEAVKQANSATLRVQIVDAKGLEVRALAPAPRHRMFPDLLKYVAAGLNVAIVGPAGAGKTMVAEQIAEALGFAFHFTGAVSSEYKLAGFIDAQGRVINTAFRRAFEHGGVFLFDEIDASLPAAVLAFNAALANGFADFPDGMVKRHADFRCIAAANTYWTGADRVYVGRNQLDGASLDRFVFVDFDYDEALESMIPGVDAKWCAYVQRVRAAVRNLRIRHIVSPRASIMGSRALAAGLSRSDVEKSVLWKGLDSASIQKVRDAVAGNV